MLLIFPKCLLIHWTVNEVCAIWGTCTLRLPELKMVAGGTLPAATPSPVNSTSDVFSFQRSLFPTCIAFTCFLYDPHCLFRMVFWEWVYISSKSCLTWCSIAFTIPVEKRYTTEKWKWCVMAIKVQKSLKIFKCTVSSFPFLATDFWGI